MGAIQMWTGGIDENGNEWAERYHPNFYYQSSCGQFWGNQPFTKESEIQLRRMKWKNRMQNLKNKP